MDAQTTQRARRMAVLCLVLSGAIVLASMLLTAAKLRDRPGDAVVSVKPLGVPIFSAEREADASELKPGAGVPIILVGLPALGAGIVVLRARSR